MYHIDDIVNTVIHGDSHIELKKIPNESVDCIIIDPPYRYLKHKLDRPFNEALIFNELYRILKSNSFLVIFGIGARLCRDIVMLEDIGFKCIEECIWVKNNITNFMCNLPRKHESFYILSKGKKEINKCLINYFEKLYSENNLDKLLQSYKRIESAFRNKEDVKDILKYLQDGIMTYKYDRGESLIGNSKSPCGALKTIKAINEGATETTVFYQKKYQIIIYTKLKNL